MSAHATIVQDMPTGQLTLKVDSARFPLASLLGFAARANALRGFLFLSRVLGKHWPVAPRAMQAVHADLAGQIPSDLPGPVVFFALARMRLVGAPWVWSGQQIGMPSRRATRNRRLRMVGAPLSQARSSRCSTL